MSGEYIINVLEPKLWDDGSDSDDDKSSKTTVPASRLSQHVSFLRDFFRSYKDFEDEQIDALEIMFQKLYKQFGIADESGFADMNSTDYPILSDLYKLLQDEYQAYEDGKSSLYTKDMLRKLCLGLDSMCLGAERKFFDGHTNITHREDSRTRPTGAAFPEGKSAERTGKFICFGVKGLLKARKNVKNALLFNVLSYMSDALLSKGNTVASMFNSALSSDRINSYVQLSQAINNQAITQNKVSPKQNDSPNEKFTFRTWLIRLVMSTT